MANKQCVAQAFLNFVGDGASSTVASNFATGPFGFIPPSGGSYSTTFDVSTLTPSAVTNLTCDGGLGATASIGLLGAVTFTITGGTPASGQLYRLSMTLEF